MARYRNVSARRHKHAHGLAVVAFLGLAMVSAPLASAADDGGSSGASASSGAGSDGGGTASDSATSAASSGTSPTSAGGDSEGADSDGADSDGGSVGGSVSGDDNTADGEDDASAGDDQEYDDMSVEVSEADTPSSGEAADVGSLTVDAADEPSEDGDEVSSDSVSSDLDANAEAGTDISASAEMAFVPADVATAVVADAVAVTTEVAAPVVETVVVAEEPEAAVEPKVVDAAPAETDVEDAVSSVAQTDEVSSSPTASTDEVATASTAIDLYGLPANPFETTDPNLQSLNNIGKFIESIFPAYPSVAGTTQVAFAVLVVKVLDSVLTSTQFNGQNTIFSLPIYVLFAAAYERLAKIGTNTLPTATVTSTSQSDDVVTMKLDIEDVDGDLVVPGFSGSTSKGSWVYNVFTGEIVYTVLDEDLLANGGTDTVYLTLDDSLGYLNHPLGDHSVIVPITVLVAGTAG